LWLIKVWFSASTFVVKIATFAKLQTVISNPNNPTVRPFTDRHNPTDNAIFGKAVWLSLRKIKRAAKPPTSRPAFAAHFILPYRTPTYRQFSVQPTIFFPIFAP
jgi:hypothetical protein